MLKRKASRDERLAQLTAHSCLLYLMSIPHLDIEGRMDGLPVAVRGTVVPYIARAQPDEWTDELVELYMVEWTRTVDADRHERPLVLWYCVKGVWVCEFSGFRDNQRLRADREAPSRFPAPPEDLLSPITPRAYAAEHDAAAEPPTAAEPLFADTSYERDPGELRGQAEAEVQVQHSRAAASVARARKEDPALPDLTTEQHPLADVAAKVAERQAELAKHGTLARLLEVLPDADENTPQVLHTLFDPLGENAIEHARREILDLGDTVRRPAAYAVGIARRIASGKKRTHGRAQRRAELGALDA